MVTRAIQFIHANFEEVEALIGADTDFQLVSGQYVLIVPTARGVLHANRGDWIVSRDGHITVEERKPVEAVKA